MFCFSIRVANLIIGVSTIYKRSMVKCRDFLTEETPEYHVKMTQKDIDYQKEAWLQLYGDCDPSERNLEFTALLMKISELVIMHDTLLIHGAAIGLNDESYLFSANTGTGKTTHILKWLKKLPDAFIVNGDKPFIRLSEDDSLFYACGSPWAGKENYYTNTMVPLKAFICMERAEYNCIKEISFSEALPFLLQQTYRPDDEIKLRKALHLLQCLNGRVKFYHFWFNNYKDDCFEVAYNTIVEAVRPDVQ